MPRNRITRWGATAPLWQLFLFTAIVFGALEQAIQPHDSILGSVLAGLFFGAAMTGVFAYRRRKDSRVTGTGTSEVAQLDRAIRSGELPPEPERRAELARLIERRRAQTTWGRTTGLILFTLFFAIEVFLVVVGPLWPNLLFVLLFAALDVFVVLQGRYYLRKLDRVAAQL